MGRLWIGEGGGEVGEGRMGVVGDARVSDFGGMVDSGIGWRRWMMMRC